MPLSLVGTFGVMYLLHYSLNNLSLMALTIATGFVVDDAIVMIENISRYIEEGEKPFEAALKGAEQIGFTIVSLTVSLIAVLIPLLFMGDVVGRLFREFAVTLAVTIVISAVVSLTLVPTLSARWLKREVPEEESGLSRVTKRTFDSVLAKYDTALTWVLDHQAPTLIVAVATLVLTAILYIVIPKGLFPTQDTGLLQGFTEAGQTISYSRMADQQVALSKTILADPAVESLSSFIGVDGTNTTLNTGRIQINLKAKSQRQGSLQQVMDRLNQRANSIAGMQLYLQPVQDLTIDAQVGKTQYQLSMEGVDQDALNTWSEKLVDQLKTMKEIRNPSTDAQAAGLSAFVNVDRDTAARLAITPASLDEILYDAFGQRIVSTIFTQSNQYRVILEAQPQMVTSPQALNKLNLSSSGGGADRRSAPSPR